MITFTFDGLDQAIAAFRATPGEMTTDARDIVETAASAAASEIRAQYPDVSGELQGGVAVEDVRGSEYYAAARVVSRSREATWWEYGTAARHNSKGAFRGRVVPHFTVTRTLVAYRARLTSPFRALLERFGLRVTG